MRAQIYLAIVVICCELLSMQQIEGKEISNERDILRLEPTSIIFNLQERSISDIWTDIKDTANRAWGFIENLAKNSKQKLKELRDKISIKAKELAKAFEERLNQIKERINEMYNDIIDTSLKVKKCLQERKQEINEILKNILFNVTDCISGSVAYLDTLPSFKYKPVPNKIEYIKDIQDQVDVCLKTNDASVSKEKCIYDVRQRIYKNMEVTEDIILQNHTETRKAADDLLGKIIECTTDGLIKSTSIIANETINIIQCVSLGQTAIFNDISLVNLYM